MKKYLILVLVIASVMTMGMVVYAESDEVPEWFTDMMDWRKGEIEEAVEGGTITDVEAEAWLLRMDEMEEFHNENGFDDFRGGGCNGSFSGGMRSGGGSRGLGRGHMSEDAITR